MNAMSGAGASFEALVQMPSESLNLAAAALAFAEDCYPNLDRGACLSALEDMAQDVAARTEPDATLVDRIGVLNDYLFSEQGFVGNREDYADPRNSYLNEVLGRRLGIPISLSVIYLEIGWRLGLNFTGVGFPGHFLVKCSVTGGEIVLDPFHGGISLGAEELTEIGMQVLGRERFRRESLGSLLCAVDRREILLRMLRNLKQVYLRREEHERALEVIERMLTVAPSSPLEVRDRARTYEALGAVRAALADYRRYLELMPIGAEAGAIAAQISALESRVKRLN